MILKNTHHTPRRAKSALRNFGALRNTGALLGASALLALAGCGGGSSNNNPTPTATPVGTPTPTTGSNDDNANLASVSLLALTNDNRLLSFNSRTPGDATLITVQGLTAGDTLRAIDFRFPAASTAPNPPITDANGNFVLYAIGQNGNSQQLYSLPIAGNLANAAPVGPRFDLLGGLGTPTAFGFDFNPTVDRIRVVEPTANRNFRLNPNTGAIVDFDPNAPGTQPDGTLTFDSSDVNAGRNPDAVGAAYTNPDADPSTGTVLYLVDSTRDALLIQGRANDPNTPADETVGPNLGRLFTVGALGIDLSQDSGFDISPSGNAAFVSNGNRVYGIAIAPGAGRGAVTGGARLPVPAGARIIGLAATS